MVSIAMVVAWQWSFLPRVVSVVVAVVFDMEMAVCMYARVTTASIGITKEQPSTAGCDKQWPLDTRN
jgi:hypothetical protein